LEVQGAHDAFQAWALEVCCGSAINPNDEDQITDYNEKATRAFALLCEHLTDAQLAHIQYCKNVKSAWETLCVWTKPKPSKQVVFSKEFLHHQNARRGRLVCAHQHGEGPIGNNLKTSKK
jgi:hypothetical protein